MEEKNINSGVDANPEIRPFEVIVGVNEVLRESMPRVEDGSFDDDLVQLIEGMNLTLHANGGIGLAANQVGAYARVIVTKDQERYYNYVNPEIVSISEDTQKNKEGCLSSAGVYELVERPMTVTVRAQNVKGEFFEETLSGLDAAVILHEIDHLNGIRFCDRLSTFRRKRLREKAFKDGITGVGPVLGESLTLYPEPVTGYDVVNMENTDAPQSESVV